MQPGVGVGRAFLLSVASHGLEWRSCPHLGSQSQHTKATPNSNQNKGARPWDVGLQLSCRKKGQAG